MNNKSNVNNSTLYNQEIWNPTDLNSTKQALELLLKLLQGMNLVNYVDTCYDEILHEDYFLQRHIDEGFYTIWINFNFKDGLGSLNCSIRIIEQQILDRLDYYRSPKIRFDGCLHISLKEEDGKYLYRDFTDDPELVKYKTKLEANPEVNAPRCFQSLKTKLKLVGLDLDTITV
jgi:hypothetical protein